MAICTPSRCRRATSLSLRVASQASIVLAIGRNAHTYLVDPDDPFAVTPQTFVEANEIDDSLDAFADQICDYLT